MGILGAIYLWIFLDSVVSSISLSGALKRQAA